MNTRPKLLFVSPRFLFPVDSGGKIRTTQILRGMHGGVFEVTLASPVPDGAEAAFAGELSGVCDRFVGWPENRKGRWFPLARLRHALGALPIPVATDRSRAGARAVGHELARDPDVVVFDFPHSVVFAPRRLDTASVMFTHNVEAEIFARHARVASGALRRALWRSQERKMRRFERETLARFDRVIAVSSRDREAFEAAGIARTATISTGVDLDYFTHAAPGGGDNVIFSGSMDWLANIDAMEFFLDEVWPRVLAVRPAARMTVVGRSPPAALVERARRMAPSWRFTGYVDDIRPHVREAAVYVVPLRVAGGTRLKVFEAMAVGCPVVSTAIGVEGLPLEAGRHYLQADAAADLAASVTGLLADRARGAALAAEARRHVERHFSFRAVAREFESICLDAVREHAASGRDASERAPAAEVNARA